MRQLDELSGPWQGRWVQNEYRGSGAATGDEQVTIRFTSGTLEGTGEDRDGAFLFLGEYNSAKVRFTKAYRRPAWDVAARLIYTGVWNGEYIAGQWMDEASSHSRGPFELWPIGSDGETLSLTELNEIQNVSTGPDRVLEPIRPRNAVKEARTGERTNGGYTNHAYITTNAGNRRQ